MSAFSLACVCFIASTDCSYIPTWSWARCSHSMLIAEVSISCLRDIICTSPACLPRSFWSCSSCMEDISSKTFLCEACLSSIACCMVRSISDSSWSSFSWSFRLSLDPSSIESRLPIEPLLILSERDILLLVPVDEAVLPSVLKLSPASLSDPSFPRYVAAASSSCPSASSSKIPCLSRRRPFCNMARSSALFSWLARSCAAFSSFISFCISLRFTSVASFICFLRAAFSLL
mmetsp:Transcript_2435/g.3363  ORF Transcript_2435/g.3363 Transcript_2435/m.3363 type:complete len:232 (-) Transcript_2435:955-1650(-)